MSHIDWAGVIKASAARPEGAFCLAAILLAVLALVFFRRAPVAVRVGMFLVLFSGFVAFAALVYHRISPQPIPPDPDARFLSDLDPIEPPDNVHGGLSLDSVYWHPKVIIVAGRSWPKGLGMHAPESGMATVRYSIPADASVFRATVGLAKAPSANCRGNANVRVALDGSEEFFANIRRLTPVPVAVVLQGEEVLTLRVDNGGDTNWCDGIAWAGARFE